MSGEGFREGEHVGDLEIVRELGSGAFGTVYLAHDRLIGRDVALKVFTAPAKHIDRAERERILSEARLVGRISSPHVVTLYRVHALGDTGLMFEMEYERGGSFADLLDGAEPLPLPRGIDILRGVALGLHAAHGEGIVHGDVKPANVLLDRQGQAKLADFGLGRLLQDPGLATTTGTPVGTPRFMAPEVVMGRRPTPAADVWSFGVMLYRVLARALPFEARNLYSLFFAIQNLPPPALDRTAPPELARLVERCLAKSPERRPRDLEAIARTLADISTAADWSAPAPVPAAVAPPPLFGRAAAVERLQRLLAIAACGEGGAVLVTGEAGIGKSALLRAAEATWRDEGRTWIETPVSPVRGLLQPLLERLQEHTTGSAQSHDVDSREQMLWKIERLIEGIAEAGPVALVVEDAHQATADELRLLTGIAERVRSMPVLLAVAYRLFDPSDGSGSQESSGRYHLLVSEARFDHIGLEGLPPDAMLEVLDDAAGELELASEVAAEVTRAAAGNPLFATEMLRHLREQGAVRERDGRLVAGPDWERRVLPRRIRDLVGARLAGLPSDQRELLDVAAVDGMEFDGEAVAAVLDLPLLKVLRGLQVVYRERGLVAARERGYAFSHPLLHEVIYEAIGPEMRRAIHRDLAEHLEARGDAVDPERIGTHWERAGERERARPHLLAAACSAERRQDASRTVDLIERAGITPATVGEAEVRAEPDACLDLAVGLADLGRYDAADCVFGVLAAVLASPEDNALRWRALGNRAKLLYHAKGVAAIDEPELRRAAEELPAASINRGVALYALGLAANSRADFDAARGWFTRADEEYRAIGYDAGRSDTIDQLATLAKLRGDGEKAERLYAEAARLSEGVGRRVNAAISKLNGDLLAFQRGALAGREESLRRSIAELELGGASNHAGYAMLVLAHVLFAEGRVADAMDLVRRARRQSQEGGYAVGQLHAAVAEAQLLVVRGELDAAERALKEAEAVAASMGRVHAGQYIDPVRMQILVFRGEFSAAADLARAALERARETAALSLAEVVAVVVETVPAGLACGVLDAAGPPSDLPDETSRRLVAGAQAWGGADRCDELEATAATLLGPGVGVRRAVRRVVGHWMRAEARRRRGERDGARAEANFALREAQALGHVWQKRLLEEWLARL